MSNANIVLTAAGIVTRIAEKEISKVQSNLFQLRKRANEANIEEKKVREAINKAREIALSAGVDQDALGAFVGKLSVRRQQAAANAKSLANEIRTQRTVIKLLGGIIAANAELNRDVRAEQARRTKAVNVEPVKVINVSKPMDAATKEFVGGFDSADSLACDCQMCLENREEEQDLSQDVVKTMLDTMFGPGAGDRFLALSK
ncbi:hypothetical protein SmaMPs15_000249 [Stenotrophomonas maltophilia phage vB_SmaM_Ps15]|uniref:Uncharacterized protein n=1 Tax=Stenotrophomonas maltophilia phage vB_SmaM_Ps15 TaxID=3071007 RepID=A0AAE9JV62_9CAUD|nr:hypothetical protein PQC01_gp229 [Stenotrophomonas maltophilia phage vB_SmaM_Ps15]UMO77400.1 hypothetical protein SmaMPs15_000249 [Stenotrophomonas maltophilia phage vB_SmaM_Ps15]